MPVRGDFPEFRDWSIAAVWLLKGAVYSDDAAIWNLVMSNVSTLETFFCRIGLRLVLDESEGIAYLRQFVEGEASDGYDSLPRLFRASRLSYAQTLLCVLLRDELRRFEEEDLRNERCVVEESILLEQWTALHNITEDEVRQQKNLVASLRQLEDLGFVKRFSDEPPTWEIRRVLKARLPVSELERLRDVLAAVSHGGRGRGGNADE